MFKTTLSYIIITVFCISCTEKIEKINPKVGVMTESVYASVTVQPAEMYDVFAAIPGILEKIYVQEGDTVEENQILAQITASNSKLNIDNAILNLELAREKYTGKANMLSTITDEIRLAEQQLKIDSLNYFRQKNLRDKNIGSQSDYENKKLKYDMIRNQISILRKKHEQTSLELKSGYKQSENALRKAKTNLSDYYIRAKMNGKVYSLLRKEGEIISQQSSLAQIGKSNTFIVEMLIDEVDIAKIRLGQLAILSLDAFEGQVFEALITKVYPLKDARTQTFKIEARFNKAPKVLYAGLSGEANIVLSEKKNALTIPLDYLIDGSKVKTDKGIVDVEVGLKNIESVEIISGINKETNLIKP